MRNLELLIDTKDNTVHTFDVDKGVLVEQVWKPSPLEIFEFKEDTKINDFAVDVIKANHPTAGIVFNDEFYIGTSDGKICTSEGVIAHRIPNIAVDKSLFLDRLNLPEEDRAIIDDSRMGNYEGKSPMIELLDQRKIEKFQELSAINEKLKIVHHQEDFLVESARNGWLGIRGFVVNTNKDRTTSLFDGHYLGISNTETGESINDERVHALHQITEKYAGFVPVGSTNFRIDSESGLYTREATKLSGANLYSLDGKDIKKYGICPRDGSGCSPAIFVTDGNVSAISHRNHPFYSLDILLPKSYDNDIIRKEKVTFNVDPSKRPTKLILMNELISGEKAVIGDYGNSIRDFSDEGKVLFKPEKGHITSMSDSGLLTVLDKDKTIIHIGCNKVAELDGSYKFLEATPQ
jgi:hypothetical protein